MRQGQFVIEDAHKAGTYLSATGWTQDRRAALQWPSRDDALEALAALKRTSPILLLNRMVDIVERRFDPDLVVVGA